MRSLLRWMLTIAAACGGVRAIQELEQPVALVLEAGGQYRHQRDNLNLPVAEGQFLFAGDTVTAAPGQMLILRCSGSDGYRVRLVQGSITFGVSRDDESEATIQGRRPVESCAFPPVEKWPAVATADTEQEARGAPSAEKTPDELQNRLARAVAKERQGDIPGAIAEYRSIADTWTSQDWARRIVYRLQSKSSSAKGTGKLYAVALGVSKYESERIPKLNYAHADAELVDAFLRKSDRGKALGGEPEIELLSDANAKYGTVRVALNQFFNRAGETDSIALFIAAHGIAYNEDGYVILHDSNIQSLYTTAISMTEIRDILATHAGRVRRVFLFVDACHAQRIGPIRDFSKINKQLQAAVGSIREGQVFAFFAASGNESAYENTRYGGGHGAFTYFLMRALNTRREFREYAAVDRNGSGDLSPEEIVEYVATSVKQSTNSRQRPHDSLQLKEFRVPLSSRPLDLPCCNPLDKNSAATVETSRDTGGLNPNADVGRSLLLDDPALARRVAVENEIHRLIQKYLDGDEYPPRREDFARGIKASEEGQVLAGSSMFLEAREAFFRGRTAIFDKCYADAERHLYRAVSIDPASPYAHNALGISFLEQAKYQLAEVAFQDAIRRAPYWAYPRHNLALVYTQIGDYTKAIASYQEAIRLVPRYSYLPYNLGLLYQRLNRDDDAEQQYRAAHLKAPARPAPLIALGALKTEQGQSSRALKYFAEAEQVLPNEPTRELLLTLRHNQAVLLARKRTTMDAALGLWRKNVDEAGYLPSRFELARAATSQEEAAAQWTQILAEVPDHAGARIEYSLLLEKAGRRDEAAQLIQAGLDRRPDAAPLIARLQKLQRATR